jgi:SAM-dependent methyltransferase
VTEGRRAWEHRASSAESEFQQVLFRNWPAELNALLHRWHVSLLHRALEELPMEGVRVLDLGCGPGRLAGELAALPAVSAIVGVDHAATFLGRYEAACRGKGQAFALDLGEEPIPGAGFHLAILVASLMYVPPGRQEAFLARVLDSLGPGGRLLIVENDERGVNAAQWWGLLRRRRTSGEPTDHVFRPGELRQTAGRAGGGVAWERGLPLFTLSLPVLWALGKTVPRSLQWLAPALLAAEGTSGPSIQRALLVRKEGGTP